jgi:hypothetical protein
LLGCSTTLVAAELTGGVCFAMEIDERYCDVTISGWQRLTSGTVTRAVDDRPFYEIACSLTLRSPVLVYTHLESRRAR